MISFKCGKMLDTTKPYSLIPVWIILAFTQGQKLVRRHELVQSYCCKIAWRIPIFFPMIDYARVKDAKKSCKYGAYWLFERIVFLFFSPLLHCFFLPPSFPLLLFPFFLASAALLPSFFFVFLLASLSVFICLLSFVYSYTSSSSSSSSSTSSSFSWYCSLSSFILLLFSVSYLIFFFIVAYYLF